LKPRAGRKSRRSEQFRRVRVKDALTVEGSLRLAGELLVNQVQLALASAPDTPRQKQLFGRAAARRARQALRELDVDCREFYDAQLALEQARGTAEEREARERAESAGGRFVETLSRLAFTVVDS
jgi:hypothetical protein